jgi:hypothetical protein
LERCASENKDLNRPWFVSNTPPFNMVPNHRIVKISIDPCNSVPSTQYFEEECLRLKALSLHIMDDSAALTQQIHILMKHHHKISASFSNSVSVRQKPFAIRDPYSEFFDHAHPDGLQLDNECGSYRRGDFAKFSCSVSATSPKTPNIVHLDVLCETCVRDFVNRMTNFCGTPGSQVKSGSTSSYNYFSSRVYVWGQVDFIQPVEECGICVGVVYRDGYKIPFSVALDGDKNTPMMCDRKENYHGWLQVTTAQVSCLCLGRLQCMNETESSDGNPRQGAFATNAPYMFLPCLLSSSKSQDSRGHNFLFIVDNLVFIGSIQLVAISVAREMNDTNGDECDDRIDLHGTRHRASKLSIQDCLKQTCNNFEKTSIRIRGRLIRQRFQFRKAKRSQFFEGWIITLSHIDESQDFSTSSSSFLQTIEVNVAIPVDKQSSSSNFIWTALKSTLRDLLLSYCSDANKSTSVIDPLIRVSSDQLTMGLAFLRVSECSLTQHILSGGWESCNNRLLDESSTTVTLQSISVHVEIPHTSREITKLGYQRFKCRLEDLQSFATIETFTTSKSSCTANLLKFNVNTKKFLPGMLSRRLCRVQSRAATNNSRVRNMMCKNFCTALATSLNTAVPSVSLADLHHDVCKVLSEKQPSHLHPSLLRRINNAKILGINFCRARVECTQCFAFLKSSNSEEEKLSCPSGCRSVHSTVKWECSAVIDDCTGQAKLYAEREAALLLLGSSLDVDAIEEGAWTCQDGVFFQPSLPPSSHLLRCIKEASIEARKHNTQLLNEDREEYLKSKPATAYHFMTALARAEYLLQQHCRQWYEKHHHLKLSLFCRCKPLSTDATSVNCTEIQVANAIDGYGLDFAAVQTCTLPPLKLILEDVCVSLEESQDDNISTAWDILHSLGSW